MNVIDFEGRRDGLLSQIARLVAPENVPAALALARSRSDDSKPVLLRVLREEILDPLRDGKSFREIEAATRGILPRGSYSLASGRMFNLLDPDPDLITPEVVATGLSKTCRYSGQLPDDVFYSVAEHSVLVSRLVNPGLALAGLLHDASEGLGMSDVVSPLKKLLPEYSRLEARMMEAVAEAFGLRADLFESVEVKAADRAILEAEQIQIRGRPAKRPTDDRYAPPADLQARGLAFRCALPAEARRMFLDRYREIVEGRP